jgi:murein DD-endopeptidase MepM/ murein hydrolase activator NlpD
LQYKRRKNGVLKIVLLMVLFVVLVAVGFVYLSPSFEQNKPTIDAKNEIYWNIKTPIVVNIEDESGVKYYKVSFVDGQKQTTLLSEVLTTVEKKIQLQIPPPTLDIFYQGKDTSLIIEAVDNSKWNFLEGNKVVKKINLTIDSKKPIANVLSNSRYIQRGGSAAVVVKVNDKNLQDAYISFNDKKRFELIPFYKEGYYMALIAWPIDIEKFQRVNLIATDKADNITITKVPLYIQDKKIRIDKIEVSRDFINNVSANVLEQSAEMIPSEAKDLFIYSNKDLRAKNVQTIEDIARDAMKGQSVQDISIDRFDRLRGSKTVAGYAERRHYYLDGEKINEAWHLGIDWASVKKAPVYVSNPGEVIFNNYLGLYGNTIIIDHGMGLATLYAHTSSQTVQVAQQVSKGDKIAHTGATGAVFGDHLHFGVLVQGVEVNPIEWMDSFWIKTRITDILQSGKKQIDESL